jgi:hypothetical protein
MKMLIVYLEEGSRNKNFSYKKDALKKNCSKIENVFPLI